MAASEHYIATQAGIEMLKNGGNAADAALSMQLVLNQVQPTSSGIGGGVFIMYYDSNSKKVYAIDGREEAPNAFNPFVFCQDINCFLQNITNYNTSGICNCSDISQVITSQIMYGGLSVGVPGTLYAYYLLHKYFGSSNWSHSFQFAIDIAKNGFELTQSLWNTINNNNKLAAFKSSRELFFKANTTTPKVEPGEMFINSDFADTLEKLSVSGDEAIEIFYKGELAQAILDIVKTEGNYTMGGQYQRWGLMEQEDINGYKAVFREPATVTYGDDENGEPQYKMHGMPMPSSGSISVEYMMNLLYFAQNDDSLSDFENGGDLTDFDIYSDVAAHYH